MSSGLIIARPLVVGGGKRLVLPEYGVLRQLRRIESPVTQTGAIIAIYALAAGCSDV
jgi:hypothetical protein